MKSVKNTSPNPLNVDKPTILQRKLVGEAALRTKEGLLLRPLVSSQLNKLISPTKAESQETDEKRDFLGRVFSETKSHASMAQPSTLLQHIASAPTKEPEESLDGKRDFLGRPFFETELEHIPTFFPQVPSVREYSFEEERRSILDWHRVQTEINSPRGTDSKQTESNAEKEKSPKLADVKSKDQSNIEENPKEKPCSVPDVQPVKDTITAVSATNNKDVESNTKNDVSLEKSNSGRASLDAKNNNRESSPAKQTKRNKSPTQYLKSPVQSSAKSPLTFIIDPSPASLAKENKILKENKTPKENKSAREAKTAESEKALDADKQKETSEFHRPSTPFNLFDGGSPSQNRKTNSSESHGVFESFFEAAKQTLLSTFLSSDPVDKSPQQSGYNTVKPARNETSQPKQDSNSMSQGDDKQEGPLKAKQEKNSKSNRENEVMSKKPNNSEPKHRNPSPQKKEGTPKPSEQIKTAPKKTSIFKSSKRSVSDDKADVANTNRMKRDRSKDNMSRQSPPRISLPSDDEESNILKGGGNALVRNHSSKK